MHSEDDRARKATTPQTRITKDGLEKVYRRILRDSTPTLNI